MNEEHALLHEFTERRSEAAFRELVRRYTDFVFSAALRQAGAGLAEDVTQLVFADFARKAASLGRTPHLGGWLHRHTRFVSLNLVRAEQRRVLRERIAMEIHDTQNDWQLIAPELDAAIDALDADDRTAVLARYFEKQDFAAIGASLGVSEGAAQRRVSRAVEELRGRFAVRGVGVAAAALAALMSANAVHAAPTGLAAAVAGGALAGSGVAAMGTANAMGWFFSAKALAVAVAAVAFGVAGFVVMRGDDAAGRVGVPPAVAGVTAGGTPTLPTAKPARSDEQKFGVWKAEKFSWQSPDAALRRPVVFNVTIPSGHERFTVAIDDAKGVRVRNLLEGAKPEDFGGDPKSGQPQTLALEWNGLDDRGQPLADSDYRVRGCSLPKPRLLYEFSWLGPGTPPWEFYKNSGWGGDHEFPNALACLRGAKGKWRVALGGRTAEGGSPGFVLGADDRKLHAFGNGWTGPNALAARDGVLWIALGGELVRVGYDTAAVLPFAKVLTSKSKDDRIEAVAAGEKIAALVWQHKERVKNPKAPADRLRLLDKATGATMREITLASNAVHNGMVFARDGALLFSTDAGLMRLDVEKADATPEPLALAGVEKTAQLATDAQGWLYVFDAGADQQVKVFAATASGGALSFIGTKGGQRELAYDRSSLRGVQAISVDDDGALWVAESGAHDGDDITGFVRRIAVFSDDGKFARHFVGGTWYGANTTCLHEQDPTLAYGYGMIFRINNAALTNGQPSYEPLRYVSRSRKDSPFRIWASSPGVLFNGIRMFRSDASGKAREYLLQTNGFPILLCADGTGDYRAVMAIGHHEHNAAFPKVKDEPKALFVWSDLNGDTLAQPEEFQRLAGTTYSVGDYGAWGCTPPRDLVFRVEGIELKPARFTEGGAPIFDVEKCARLAKPGVSLRVGQHLVGYEHGRFGSAESGYYFAGNYVFTDLAGARVGHIRANWPAVHGSWSSALYAPGQTGRTTGDLFTAGILDLGGDAGSVYVRQGNKGQSFVLSEDGLFVTTLFRDSRERPAGFGEKEIPGADWTDTTLNDEAFGGWCARQDDGVVRYSFGRNACHVVRIEGLEKMRRFDAGSVKLAGKPLATATSEKSEGKSQKLPLRIVNTKTRTTPFVADGDLAEWKDIPRHEIRIGEEVVARIALATDYDKLHILAEVTDTSPAKNAAREPNFLFKSGDALDVQFGPRFPARTTPSADDTRIVIAPGDGKPVATRYRPVKVDAKPEEAVTFESPVRKVTFASVKKLDGLKAVFTATATGYTIEATLRCEDIGLADAAPGLRVRGDIGVLFSNEGGEGVATRAYLHDHSPGASIVSDTPSEAEMRPAEWDEWILE